MSSGSLAHRSAARSASSGVKRLLDRIRPAPAGTDETSGFFGSAFDEGEPAGATPRTSWSARAAMIGARALPTDDGRALLERVLLADPPAVPLSTHELHRLTGCFAFADLAPDRELITQDERGDYLVVILDGAVAVDRVQLWGGRVGLGEARLGDVLGEMSLLDAGPRFSTCTTLEASRVAVLEAAALDNVLRDDPRVALALVAMLARRLSLRLRHVSTRLTALLERR